MAVLRLAGCESRCESVHRLRLGARLEAREIAFGFRHPCGEQLESGPDGGAGSATGRVQVGQAAGWAQSRGGCSRAVLSGAGRRI